MDESPSLRVVVADDHPLFLEALAHLVTDAAGMELVGRAATGTDLIECVAECDPDVVVTDLRMPGVDGIEAIRRMRQANPSQRVLVLSMHDEDALISVEDVWVTRVMNSLKSLVEQTASRPQCF